MDEPTIQRTILLIEPDRERSQLITTALQTEQHRVIPLENGSQTLAYLDRCGKDEDKPRPDLILLELNLPAGIDSPLANRDGREILAEIKNNAQLRRIPIIVLTTATSADDIFNTYELQGNCHVVKSDDLDRLLTIVRRIEAFWLGLVTLPMA